MNPGQIADRMEIVLTALDEMVDEMRTAGQEHAAAERKFKSRYAQARVEYRATKRESSVKFTTDEVEDYATIKTDELRFDATLAQSTLSVCREALRVKEAELDALRSMSAALRGAGG